MSDLFEISEEEFAEPRRRGASPKKGFDWTFNLGHLAIVASLLVSAAGLYAHDEARYAVLDTKVETLWSQNLPPRVSALESQTADLKDWMKRSTDLLAQIRDGLDRKEDKRLR